MKRNHFGYCNDFTEYPQKIKCANLPKAALCWCCCSSLDELLWSSRVTPKRFQPFKKMKFLLILVMISCLTTRISASNEDTALAQSNTAVTFREFIGKGLSELWTWIVSLGKSEDTFVGRCFGVAKRIKQLLPIIIFKLGVIMTTLGFLTIFSMKSLALLVLLVIINSTGLISKLALFKGHQEDKPHGQNIHFHIHQNKHGQYHVDHSGPGYEAWDRSSLISDFEDDSISDRLKRFNIYK